MGAWTETFEVEVVRGTILAFRVKILGAWYSFLGTGTCSLYKSHHQHLQSGTGRCLETGGMQLKGHDS
jgi:hypothetical protein